MAERTLPVDDLTDDAFAPFGTVVRRPSRPHDATGPGWQWWAETVVLQDDGRPWSVGYLDLEPAAPRFDWAERHLRSQEAIVPISGGCLVYVPRPDHPDHPARLPPVDALPVCSLPPISSRRVWRPSPGSGVVMHPAVWQGAPIAEEPAKARPSLLAWTTTD